MGSKDRDRFRSKGLLGTEYAKGGGVYEVEAERRWKRWNL
jgi:hypothetical protein